MSNSEFYDFFHKKAGVQYKLISKKNITYRVILSELERQINITNINILDFGCGVGTLSLFYASMNNRVIGIDISSLAINNANKSKKNLRLGNSCKFYTIKEFNNEKYKNYFDLIICSEVIEHIENDKDLINIFHKMLKKSGYLIITTPNVEAPLFRWGLLNEFDKKVGHLRRYKKNDLEITLIKNKYNIVISKYTEGLLRNILYTNDNFGFLLRFLKGLISDIFTNIDNLSIKVFGGSNILIIAQKI